MTDKKYVKALVVGWKQKRLKKVEKLLIHHGIFTEWHWPFYKNHRQLPKAEVVICSTDNNSHSSATYIRLARKKGIPVIHIPARRSTASKILTRAGFPRLSNQEIADRALATSWFFDGVIPPCPDPLDPSFRSLVKELAIAPIYNQQNIQTWISQDEESQEIEAESESEDSAEQINPQQEDTMSNKNKKVNTPSQRPPALITLSQAASLIQKGEQSIRDAINQARLTFIRDQNGDFLLDPIEVKKLPTNKLIYTMDSVEEKKYLMEFLPKKISSEPWRKDAEYSVGLIKELQEENGGTPRGWLVTRLLGSLRSQFGIKHRNAGSSGTKIMIYMDYTKYSEACTTYGYTPIPSTSLSLSQIKLKNIPATKAEKPKEKPMLQPKPEQKVVEAPQVLAAPKASTSLEDLLKEVRKKMADRAIVKLVVTPTECEAQVMVVQTMNFDL